MGGSQSMPLLKLFLDGKERRKSGYQVITKHIVICAFISNKASGGGKETADPSTTLPRISCRTEWHWRSSCRFPYESRTRGRWLVPRSRKSRCAPVGMTILLWELALTRSTEVAVGGTTKLSSRPERSEVEGPAVSFPRPEALLLINANSSPKANLAKYDSK